MAKYENDPENDRHMSGAPRCRAARSDGERCGNIAAHGTGLCKNHGGRAPAIRAGAEKRELEQKAQRLLSSWNPDPEPVDNPILELSRMAGQATALKDMAYAASEPREACDCCGRGETDATSFLAWNLVAKTLTNQLIAIEKIGLAAKVVSIQEQMVGLIFDAMDRALTDVFPNVDQTRVDVHDRFRHHLEIVEANQKDARETVHTRSTEVPADHRPDLDTVVRAAEYEWMD